MTICMKAWTFGILFDSAVPLSDILILEMYGKETVINKGKDLSTRTFTIFMSEMVKSWEQCKEYQNIYMIKYYAAILNDVIEVTT